ncbi:MAG: sulfotransferase [Desulfobacterales bacterium]|jgi:hypothetical protein
MIIAIGNPPSSGSTYLADLLDSLPFAVCGPEVNLFSAKDYFTQFNKIKKKGFFSSQSPAVYQSRQKLLEDRLCSWGIDRILLRHILSNTISYKDFCHKLFNVFADIRGKKCKLFFEKTPQNIHCARQFLDTFDEGIFLHIVRDPLFVYKSLINRNFPAYIAASTWLIDESSACHLFKHHRFITIYYEKLVQDPFNTICNLIKKVGIEYDPEDLQKDYENNSYRKVASRRIRSWSISKYGVSGNANVDKSVTENDLNALKFMLTSKVSKRYAKEFNIPDICFRDLIAFHGYQYSYDDLPNKHHRLYDTRSLKLLIKKFLSDLKHHSCNLDAFFSYIKPIDWDEGKCVG